MLPVMLQWLWCNGAKYRTFIKFPGVEILWKCLISTDSLVIRPKLCRTFVFPQSFRPKNYVKFKWFCYLLEDLKFLIPYNPGQIIYNKIEKSSKTGHGKKGLISTFSSLLTAFAKG